MSNWNQPQAPPGYPQVGPPGYPQQAPGYGGPSPSAAGWGAPPPGPEQDGAKAAYGGGYGAGYQQQQQAQPPPPGMPPMGMGMMMPPVRPPVADPESQAMGDDMAFATVQMRNAFVRKVFGIVTIQLLITVGVAAACLFVPEIKNFVRSTPALYYVAWGIAFAVVLVIACVEKARRQFPLNLVLLTVFTLAEAYLVGMITAFHNIEAVMLAFLVTTAAVAGLTIFAMNTKIDATKWGSMLGVVMIVLLVLVIIGIFWRTKILYLAISGIAAILFSAYLIYDIQLVMGNRGAAYSPDDYIAAALSIYLDVINIFIAILNIIGLTSNN